MTEINYPNISRVVTPQSKRAILGIQGRSGVGKSHLVSQLVNDSDYGPDEILVAMSEDSTSKYGGPVHVVKVESFDHVIALVDEQASMAAKGLRVPKVFVWDSPSGTGDDEKESYNENPIMSQGGKRDKLAEFGDFGERFTKTMRRFHLRAPWDVIVLMTSYEREGGGAPELAVPGKMIPKNFTRLTSTCLHMRAIMGTFDPMKGIPAPAPHREVAFNEAGAPIIENGAGIVINRYFYTRDAGEVMAKGHPNLAVRERAVLPEILRRIHGVAPLPKEIA